MNKLTGHISRNVLYDPWELCGLDNVCKRLCLGCKIPNMITKLMRYEDTGWEPEELNKKILHEYAYGWIPCSERLPEERVNTHTHDYQEYQVTADFGEYGGLDVRTYKFGGGHWWCGIQNMDKYVVAWLPRPEPYKDPDND